MAKRYLLNKKHSHTVIETWYSNTKPGKTKNALVRGRESGRTERGKEQDKGWWYLKLKKEWTRKQVQDKVTTKNIRRNCENALDCFIFIKKDESFSSPHLRTVRYLQLAAAATACATACLSNLVKRSLTGSSAVVRSRRAYTEWWPRAQQCACCLDRLLTGENFGLWLKKSLPIIIPLHWPSRQLGKIVKAWSRIKTGSSWLPSEKPFQILPIQHHRSKLNLAEHYLSQRRYRTKDHSA